MFAAEYLQGARNDQRHAEEFRRTGRCFPVVNDKDLS